MSTEIPKIALIFDCDGTILDSYDAIADRIYRGFKHFDIEESKERIGELCLFHNVDYCVRFLAAKHQTEYEEVKTIFIRTASLDIDCSKADITVDCLAEIAKQF